MSFRTALSGLNAAQADLNVTGNNIANVNTTGFKQSRTEFVDVYATSFQGVSNIAPGSGVRVSAIAQQFGQGNIEFTANGLDLAINGEGFFVVNDGGTVLYSRAGAFHVDRNGYIVNSLDSRLQVYPASTSGTFNTGVLSDLQVQTAEGVPSATTSIDVGINVDAGDSEPALAFDVTNPNTYNNSTSVVVYDSLGSPHTATMYFRKDESLPAPTVNAWDVYLYVDGTVVTSGAASPIALAFSNAGVLTTAQPTTYDAIALTTGAADIDMSIDFSDVTQYGSQFTVNSLTQDGYSTGRLSGVEVSSEGVVSARYTNGQSQVLGKVAMANFPNNQGLAPRGDSVWAETFTSGNRVLGEANSGTFGLIQSGALEASNVDIAEQLVSLITAQRNYQANAQVISTEDTVTQTIINIR